MADETETVMDDPFLLAGALVLGVLEGEERVAAQRMQLGDPAFRRAVEWWEWRLGAMAEAAPAIAPPPGLLRAIEARIDALESEGTLAPHAVGPPPTRGPSRWSIATALAGAGMAAAAIALYFSTPGASDPVEPTVAVADPGPQLIAQLADEDGERRLASRIDRDSGMLALSIAGLDAEAGFAPELWVIPEGGSPVSLGAIPEQGEFERELSEAEAGLLREGATIAVTFERDTGERHEAPTPPILLAGALDQV